MTKINLHISINIASYINGIILLQTSRLISLMIMISIEDDSLLLILSPSGNEVFLIVKENADVSTGTNEIVDLCTFKFVLSLLILLELHIRSFMLIAPFTLADVCD